MSRIHDALKKAAAERAALSPGDLPEALVDIKPSQDSDPASSTADNKKATSDNLRNREGRLELNFADLLARCSRPKWNFAPEINVFENADSKREGAERFRTLRSRLYQIAGTRPLKRILVTSSLAAEGKTFVASNLAHSIVRQPDRRVLLIDADLRAPRLHMALGAPSKPGLTDYLHGDLDEYGVIQCGPSENLCLIPGGTEVSNPSELLLGDRMRHLLDVVTPLFNFVILDSPPAVPVHDPNLLADLCDGTLFVVRAGSTNHEVAVRAADEFRKKNALGVVLNGVEAGTGYGQYYLGSYGGDRYSSKSRL